MQIIVNMLNLLYDLIRAVLDCHTCSDSIDTVLSCTRIMDNNQIINKDNENN